MPRYLISDIYADNITEILHDEMTDDQHTRAMNKTFLQIKEQIPFITRNDFDQVDIFSETFEIDLIKIHFNL